MPDSGSEKSSGRLQRQSKQRGSPRDQERVASSRGFDAAPEEMRLLGETLLGGDYSQNTFERHAAVLADSLSSRKISQRTMIVQRLQRDYGNRYVQRLVNHVRQQRGVTVQTKLTVGPAADKYEQEADRVAKHVMEVTSSPDQEAAQRQDPEEEELLQGKPDLQRQGLEEEDLLQGKPELQQGPEEEEPLQGKPEVVPQVGIEGGDVDAEVDQSVERARGQGRPLPENVRSSMEEAFSADFSGVRLHTGAESDALNKSVNARAFTTGRDIFFKRGEYDPGSSAGKEILAHELTHVVQQNGSAVQRREQQSDRLAAGVSPLPGEAGATGELEEPVATVQRVSKGEVYKGGAELEYREGKAEMTFTDLPVAEGQTEEGTKKLIRSGMKGIDIKSISDQEKRLTGDHWALTVETSTGTKLGPEGKMPVELELILGGPTGSTLNTLKTAAGAATEGITALDTGDESTLDFGNAGNTIRDNVKSKKKARAKAKSLIAGPQRPEPQDPATKALALDWSGLRVRGTWDPQGKKPQDAPWGLQVTMGVPLDEIEAVGQALQAKSLTDTSEPKPKTSEEVTWSAADILEQWHKSKPLTAEDLQEKDLRTMFSERHNEEFDPESEDHVALLDSLYKEWRAEGTTSLHAALDKQVKGEDDSKAAPSLAVLDGLARVLAAYVRGMNQGSDQGPKHMMKFVNKNPLPAVIANAASTMPDSFYDDLRDACTDLVMSKAGSTAVYRWTGAEDLKVSDWGSAMKEKNIDLVAEYDKAYRSGQIGGLSELNIVGQGDDEPLKAPVIEFRDLGSKKPSEMKAVFEEIITKVED